MKKYFYLFILLALPGILAAQQSAVFDLKSCLETGLENNYSIRISRNDEQVTKNNVTLGYAGFLPTIDLTGSYTGNLNTTETKLRETGVTTKDSGVFDQTLNAGIALNWTIFDGFRITTNYERLKELEKMGEVSTRITIEDFIANLTAEYYNYLQQQIRLKNLRYATTLSKERLRIVEARYSIGSFSRLDLQQARVDFNADSSRYMKQQELVNTSRIQLNELMARPDLDCELIIPDSVINLDVNLNFDELKDGILHTNAALLRAEQYATLAELDLKTVLSRNYPYVKLSSGYGYTLNKYEIAANSRRTNLGFNAGITVGFNLFDGNRRREKRNAKIAIDNANLSRQQVEQSLQADFNTLWKAYLNNIELLKLERENLVAAKENLEIATERYMLGDLSGIEMREAQKSLLDAEERILSAEYDTKLCEISLLQVSGKIIHYLGGE
ncbi:TolC family protein [Bacteroides sp. OttesenSCG-928-D19]|nr:TolC family protein [Bacteroides sp. OttesenSCG-928-D19]